MLSVDVEPWIAAPEGTRGVDDALASFQRGCHASTREINMALSGLISVDGVYDYKKSIVLSVRDKKTNDVISAAVMVEHDRVGGTILELIWFVTQRKMENKKYGTVLFRCIRDLARLAGCKALCITSTPQATGFWLLYVVRLKEQNKQASMFTTTVIRHPKLDKGMMKAERELGDKQKVHFEHATKAIPAARTPGLDVAKLYPPYSGSNFYGAGFRYKTDVCSHIWLKLDIGSATKCYIAQPPKEVTPERDRREKERSERAKGTVEQKKGEGRSNGGSRRKKSKEAKAKVPNPLTA